MTTFINLTPHALRLRVVAEDTNPEPREDDIVIPPALGADGKSASARVATTPGGVIGDAGGVPIYAPTAWGGVVGLPDPAAGTIFVVSGMVAARVSDRPDVVCPGTGPNDSPVRTAAGQIFAITRLNQAG